MEISGPHWSNRPCGLTQTVVFIGSFIFPRSFIFLLKSFSLLVHQGHTDHTAWRLATWSDIIRKYTGRLTAGSNHSKTERFNGFIALQKYSPSWDSSFLSFSWNPSFGCSTAVTCRTQTVVLPAEVSASSFTWIIITITITKYISKYVTDVQSQLTPRRDTNSFHCLQLKRSFANVLVPDTSAHLQSSCRGHAPKVTYAILRWWFQADDF